MRMWKHSKVLLKIIINSKFENLASKKILKEFYHFVNTSIVGSVTKMVFVSDGHFDTLVLNKKRPLKDLGLIKSLLE